MKALLPALLLLAIPSLACTLGPGQEEASDDDDDDDDDDWGAEADADTDADTDADADDDTGEDTDTDLSQYIDTTELPSGDLDCYDGSTWNDLDIDPDCTDQDFFFDKLVADFETGDAVPDATVAFFLSNDPSDGSEPIVETTDSTGKLGALDLPGCTPFSTSVTTDPALAETKTTIQQHWIYAGGVHVGGEVTSVSSTTYMLIPSLLGVSVDPSRALLAGMVLDCDGDPMAGAQVVFRSADGSIDTTQQVNYFVNDFPNREQATTSDDGLFLVTNAPVGQGRLEAWTWNGDEHVRQAMGDTNSEADAFTWVDLHVGLAHGVLVPPDCEDC